MAFRLGLPMPPLILNGLTLIKSYESQIKSFDLLSFDVSVDSLHEFARFPKHLLSALVFSLYACPFLPSRFSAFTILQFVERLFCYDTVLDSGFAKYCAILQISPKTISSPSVKLSSVIVTKENSHRFMLYAKMTDTNGIKMFVAKLQDEFSIDRMVPLMPDQTPNVFMSMIKKADLSQENNYLATVDSIYHESTKNIGFENKLKSFKQTIKEKARKPILNYVRPARPSMKNGIGIGKRLSSEGHSSGMLSKRPRLSKSIEHGVDYYKHGPNSSSSVMSRLHSTDRPSSRAAPSSSHSRHNHDTNREPAKSTSRFDEHGTLMGERTRMLDTFGVGVMKKPGRDSLSNRTVNKGSRGTSQSQTKATRMIKSSSSRSRPPISQSSTDKKAQSTMKLSSKQEIAFDAILSEKAPLRSARNPRRSSTTSGTLAPPNSRSASIATSASDSISPTGPSTLSEEASVAQIVVKDYSAVNKAAIQEIITQALENLGIDKIANKSNFEESLEHLFSSVSFSLRNDIPKIEISIEKIQQTVDKYVNLTKDDILAGQN
ncbi:hypothetical protein BKA69DRAFT_1062825 [Paraphysoderma sedebokerense]|nr:hypothetical protein BKA69DRAFT_1062825 [Paraphysoderma sedebokerense]